MNKQEIEHKLEQARKDERAIGDNIIKLLEQLAEAEKPKIGHGDFGINKDNRNFVATKAKLPFRELEPYYENGGSDGCDYAKSNPEDYTIFGNIFDLMKDWGEDLEEFSRPTSEIFGSSPFRVVISSSNCIDFITGKNVTFSCFDLAEAEEIWRKLGQMIMTIKRKQS